MKRILSLIMVALLSVTINLDAKSSGSSSSSRSSGSSRSSTSSSKSFGSSSKSYSKPSTPSTSTSKSATKPNTSKVQTSTRPTSNVDKAKYEAASKAGTTFTTRESAVAAFKAKNASTYTNKFATEPAKRPDFVPNTYKANGTTYNVTYNQTMGGYGYWNGGGPGLGTFLMYDLMLDSMHTDHMMKQQNYYVGDPPVVHGGWYYFFVTLVVILGIGGVIMMIYILNKTD